MRIVRLLPVLLTACVATALPLPVSSAATTAAPTLVGIRAAHHAGFDRIVFRFDGAVPASHVATYVDTLVGDGSGIPIPVAGRAILSVRFDQAQAHDAQGPTVPARKAFALPNVLTTVQAGDFEGVTTFGIGLAKKTAVRVTTLTNPSRVVIEVGAAFPTVDRKVYLFDRDRFVANTLPFFTPVMRPILASAPATGVMDRLFAGPVASERAAGLRLLRSHATGFANLSIADAVVRVRLTGGCNSDGSTVTVAGEIMPTLRQFASVDWVKIFDPTGHTENPTGHSDSIPASLEP